MRPQDLPAEVQPVADFLIERPELVPLLVGAVLGALAPDAQALLCSGLSSIVGPWRLAPGNNTVRWVRLRVDGGTVCRVSPASGGWWDGTSTAPSHTIHATRSAAMQAADRAAPAHHLLIGGVPDDPG